MSAPWIKTADRLPPLRKYVIARHNRGTCFDKDDQDNVNVVIVKRVENGAGVQMGNNKESYFYNTFGPGSFYGQEIIEWMEIPEWLPDTMAPQACNGKLLTVGMGQ